MIKSENGKVWMEGNIVSLSVDLGYILKGFRDTLENDFPFIDPDDYLAHIVRMSGMTDEEVKKENEILRRKLEESEESGCAFNEVPVELTKREKDVLKKLFGINDGGWND